MTDSNALMMAILSMDAYNRDDDKGIAISGPNFDAPQIGTANFIRQLEDQGTSFYAAAYGLADGEVVISYRGTRFPGAPNLGDILYGWTLSLGFSAASQAQKAYQDKLSIESLRAITGSAEKDRVIFVEDEFAKDWLEDMLRQASAKTLAATEIHFAGGYPYVVEVTKHHNKNPTTNKKAVAVIDGDAQGVVEDVVFKLPGEVPEDEVFSYISGNVEELSSLIQQRCHCPTLDQDKIVKALRKASMDTNDPHMLFRRAAENMGFLSELVVRRGLISIYNEKNSAKTKSLVESLKEFAS